MLPEHLIYRQPVPCVRFDWFVLMKTDSFGTGYIAHHENHVNDAMREGFVIVANAMTAKEAYELREQLSCDQASVESVWS